MGKREPLYTLSGNVNDTTIVENSMASPIKTRNMEKKITMQHSSILAW